MKKISLRLTSYLELVLITLFLLVNEKSLTQPLSASITSSTNALCFGSKTGSATVTATGGNSPYTYHWGNEQNTPTATMLRPGKYDVTVTDEDSSAAYASVTITSPPRIFLNSYINHISCFAVSDGSISLTTVSGGVSPYTYLWSNGKTTNFINDVRSGTYTVTVTDNNNCIESDSYILVQPDNLLIQPTNLHHETSSGLEDGSITIQVFGGVPPIMANWSNGLTGLSINNLAPDTYIVTVTDNNDCTERAAYVIDPGENMVPVFPTPPLKKLNVHPVPAKDILIIDSEKNLREVIISGIDSRIHKKFSALSSNRIDVSDLWPGWYMVRVFDGKDWYTARIVKLSGG